MAYEEVDLPVYRRHVAVTHEGSESTASGPPGVFRGLLRPFSGVLGVDVFVRDWPAPALSHLTLDRLAATALEDSSDSRRSSEEESRSTGDSASETVEDALAPDTDDDASEPRVREVIREESDRSGETGLRTDLGVSEAAGRPRADEVGVVVDRSSVDEAVGAEEPPRTDVGRSPVADRGVADRSRADETGATERTVRTDVVRREETRRVGDDESSASVTRSGDVEEPATGETGQERPREGSGNDDGPGVAVEIPGDDGSDDSRGSAPAGIPPTVAGSISREWDGPALTVSRNAPGIPSTRRDRPDSSLRRDRSRPRQGSDTVEGRTTDVERSRRDDVPSLAGSDPGSVDSGVRMEPLEQSGGAERGTAPAVAEPGPVTAVAGDRGAETGGRGRPLMAVRRDDGSDDGTGSGDSGVERPGSRTGAADDAGSPVAQSPRGTADRNGTSDPQRIDDLVDVDRLVDRLSRAFERKARIERERRGR